MPRTVRTFLPVIGDADALVAAFAGDPTRWLPGASRDGPDRFVFRLPAGTFTQHVVATVGPLRQHAQTYWRTIRWRPVTDDGTPGPTSLLLPEFDGELGLHIAGSRMTLLIDGRYRPPGGAVGRAADTIALGRVARRTIEQVLGDITARLGAEAVLRQEGLTVDSAG